MDKERLTAALKMEGIAIEGPREVLVPFKIDIGKGYTFRVYRAVLAASPDEVKRAVADILEENDEWELDVWFEKKRAQDSNEDAKLRGNRGKY